MQTLVLSGRNNPLTARPLVQDWLDCAYLKHFLELQVPCPWPATWPLLSDSLGTVFSVNTHLIKRLHSSSEVNLCHGHKVTSPNALGGKWSFFWCLSNSSLPLPASHELLACLPAEGQGRDGEASLCCRQHICAGLGPMHSEVLLQPFFGGRERWGGVFSSTQTLPSQRQWSKRSFPGRLWMKRALWPCGWQANAPAVSNVSSSSSLWLETSWRALSDKMHFPSQTSFLRSGWFLALAENAPNLWCQFYFRFHFCQQCCVLEFDFAPHSKKIRRLPFPSLSPLGLTRTGGCLNIVLSQSLCASLHDTTREFEPQTGLPSLPCPIMICYVLAFTLLFLSWFFFLFACNGKGWKRYFFSLSGGMTSVLHNLSLFSVSLH